MPGGVYLIAEDGNLVEMNESPDNPEGLLQGLLAIRTDSQL